MGRDEIVALIREIVREEIKKALPKSKAAKKMTDDEWLKALPTDPAYKHIDLPHELAKMDSWLSINTHRQKTRRFIVNWLNKIPKPVEVTTNGHVSGRGWSLTEERRYGRI